MGFRLETPRVLIDGLRLPHPQALNITIVNFWPLITLVSTHKI